MSKDMPRDMGASRKRDRAGRPPAQAPAGLGDTATIASAEQLSAHIGHLEDRLRDARDALFQIGLSHNTFVCLLGGPTKTGTHVWRGQLGTASVNFALHAETRARETVEAIEQLLAPRAQAIEARQGEDAKTGFIRKDESAVHEVDAPNPNPDTSDRLGEG